MPAPPFMLDQRVFREAERQLIICNACRYCEGLCPVFPALERRNRFLEGDILYLANLCHDCRACVPACPYTAPHELNIDVPNIMAQVRRETYAGYAAPRLFGRLFTKGARAAGIATVLSVAVVVLLVWVTRSDRLFEARVGPGAFYEVIPWLFMVIPAMIATAYGLIVMAVGVLRFWRDTDAPVRARLSPRALISATTDVLVLRQMHGGGPGCSYPEERPTYWRVLYHQLIFYGFLGTFAATTVAAIYQEFFGLLPPYPILSLPVLLGTFGGVAQVIGCAGLIALRVRGARQPATRVLMNLDVAFVGLLLATNLTGLLLLIARETSAMGLLLAVHLGVVAGLFITLPYNKFVHIIYRYAALVQNRQEERTESQPA